MGASVFFFQAKDGIRDVAVTGVQTCALPISRSIADQYLKWATAIGDPLMLVGAHCATGISLMYVGDIKGSRDHCERSEERRVGKEGKSGSRAGHGGTAVEGDRAGMGVRVRAT